MFRLYSFLIILSIFWGSSFLFNELLSDDIIPFGIVFGRSLFGFLFLIIYGLVKKERIFDRTFPFLFFLLIAIINTTIPWTLIPNAQHYVSSGLASILNALTPLMTIIVGTIFFKTKLVKKQYVGVLIGFLGMLILVDLPSVFTQSNNQWIGALLMILATTCYATSNHLTKKFLSSTSVFHLSLYTLFFTSIMSFILSIGAGQDMRVFFELDVIAIFIALGVFGSGVAYLLYYYIIQKGSAELGSLVTYLVPISAIMWGIIFLNESLTVQMIVGLLVIFSGVYLSSSSSKIEKEQIKKERDGVA